MTDDLVKRLREMCGDDGILAMRDLYDTDVAAAADRIEKLEKALCDIAQYASSVDLCHFVEPETRKILNEIFGESR
jgi:hypothetical protein